MVNWFLCWGKNPDWPWAVWQPCVCNSYPTICFSHSTSKGVWTFHPLCKQRSQQQNLLLSRSFCKSMAALLTWPRFVLQLLPGGMEEPAACSVFEQHCTHPKIPEMWSSVHRLLVSEKGLVHTGFQCLWGCALGTEHFTELPALWAERSFNHLVSKWQHCRERPRRPGLDSVAWKDNEEWHLTRPSSLRLTLDAHLCLHHYFSLENPSLMEANVVLPLLSPFMLAWEKQLLWENI